MLANDFNVRSSRLAHLLKGIVLLTLAKPSQAYSLAI